MATRTLRILGVHGLGDHRHDRWKRNWESALATALAFDDDIEVAFRDLSYDHIMEKIKLTWEDHREAVQVLLNGRARTFGAKSRGLAEWWNLRPGYVVAWAVRDDFRKEARKLVLDRVRETRPDVILAHSMGTLLTYDAFTHPDAAEAEVSQALKQAHFVTIGSQIGNSFVQNARFGRIEALENLRFWHHVYNKHDDVFTAPIAIPEATNFRQTLAEFDNLLLTDGGDHSDVGYIKHANTIQGVWRAIALDKSAEAAGPRVRRVGGAPLSAELALRRKERVPNKRALIVGINEYPNEGDRLAGCVNDAYLMSAMLQECGFPADSIRLCLNDRATTAGILERLEWLLDDPRTGDERIFYYSGHGARMPEYGPQEEPDHHVETLVPWDFDWGSEHMITDDAIRDLYAQLPYGLRFMMVLDCCHSAGTPKAGGPRPKALAPPDDIRHRELEWDHEKEMWVPRRGFKPINRDFSRNHAVNRKYFGKDLATHRLGRAARLRGAPESKYRSQALRTRDIVGPYEPLILAACEEIELSYEYSHGATAYGAFTYCLDKVARQVILGQGKRLTFTELVTRVRDRLAQLGFKQTPEISGPAAVRRAIVPWRRPQRKRKASSGKASRRGRKRK